MEMTNTKIATIPMIFGDVHYVVLDTQFKEAEGFHDNLRDDEVAWAPSGFGQ